MVTSLRTLATVAGAAAILAVSSPSVAAPMLSGSLSLGGLDVTQDGANLALSTMITAADTNVTSAGLGDYSPIGPFDPFPTLTLFGPHTLDLTSEAALAAGFSLSNANYGSFAATSATIVQRTANFLDIFILGVFTPGPGLPGFMPTDTSLRISVNQSGASLSEAITLNSPPVRVPEPASLSLLGIGLAGVAIAARRRHQR